MPTLRICVVALCLCATSTLGCARFARPMVQDGAGESSKSSDNSADSSNASADSSNASADSSGSSEDSGSDGSNSESGSGGGDGNGAASATVSVAIAVGILGLVWLAQLSRMGGGGGGNPIQLGAAERVEAVDGARRWLADNRRQVRVDIARGAGPFVDELALVHGLPLALRPRMGAALQQAHRALDAPLAEGAPSAMETERFAAALGEALGSDPVLARHIEAVEARSRR